MWVPIAVALLALVQSQPIGSLQGVVLDREAGAPIARVSVRVQATGATTVTGEDGRFLFTNLPAGDHELYVSAVDFLLVRRRVEVPAGGVADVTIVLTEGTGVYTETVDVSASEAGRAGVSPVEGRIRGIELLQLSGGLANDPLRAVQALPGVAASDDLRSEFAVRGSGPRQNNFVFEGLATPLLLHTVQQVRDSGSVAMMNGQVLDNVTLRNGSYAQRYGNRTGAELEFAMREGTRERFRAHASASVLEAAAVMEGPIGRSGRGSWLTSVRRSYMDLILRRIFTEQNVSFTFYDAQVKAVYDTSPSSRLELAVTTGRSNLDLRADEIRNPNELEDAANGGTVAVATWRLTPSRTWSVTQRAGVTAGNFENVARDGPVLDAGRARELIYRVDALAIPGGWATFEGGGEIRRSSAFAEQQRQVAGRLQVTDRIDGTGTTASVYAMADLAVNPRLSLAPGLRVDRWTTTRETAVSPWILGRWRVSDRMTVRWGGGVYRQPPALGEVLGARGGRDLTAERAIHGDAGVDGPLPGGFAWRATVYVRRERGMLRLPLVEPRLDGARLILGSTTTRWTNALNGSARGVEWLVERRARNGVSGWISYAYGRTRHRDTTTGEAFWGDFDQRHTINAFATYRTSDRMSVGVRFRAGSNLPATGYWTERDGVQYLSGERNLLRVPSYSRLDLRMDRTFTWTEKRLTLFVDVLNVTRRRNVRYLPPGIDRRTFAARGMFEGLIPLVPSVGALLEF